MTSERKTISLNELSARDFSGKKVSKHFYEVPVGAKFTIILENRRVHDYRIATLRERPKGSKTPGLVANGPVRKELVEGDGRQYRKISVSVAEEIGSGKSAILSPRDLVALI